METEVLEIQPEETVEKPSRGDVGRTTYEGVKSLIEGGMKPTEAFAQYADQVGKNAATVATAYYRVARAHTDAPTGINPRRRRSLAAPKVGRPKSNKKDSPSRRVQLALTKISEGLEELQDLMPMMKGLDEYEQIRALLKR